MIFILITFIVALCLSAISGYFSVIGILAIYPAFFIPILAMGITIEVAKIVSVTWLKINWDKSPILIRSYLLLSVIVLMFMTSVGAFGYLSKAHLQQGAATINNSAKVERLVQQIDREKSLIADNDKIIAQLDSSINSYIGKDRTDRAVRLRKSQEPQRNQLRTAIEESQRKIDAFSDEKLKLDSEVRNLELEVGPIRYIAELFYGSSENSAKDIEFAVRMFTLLIVLTLDPLAVVLLVAANQSLMMRQKKTSQPATNTEDEKEKVAPAIPVVQSPEVVLDGTNAESKEDIPEISPTSSEIIGTHSEEETHKVVNEEDFPNETKKGSSAPTAPPIISPESAIQEIKIDIASPVTSIIRQPRPTQIGYSDEPENISAEPKELWYQNNTIFREMLGDQQLSDMNDEKKENKNKMPSSESTIPKDAQIEDKKTTSVSGKTPKILGWLEEFKKD